MNNRVYLVIIRNNRLLFLRKKRQRVFQMLSAVIHDDESTNTCLTKAVQNILGCKIVYKSLQYLGSYTDDMFFCGRLEGRANLAKDIEEVRWLSPYYDNLELLTDKIPDALIELLKKKKFIDKILVPVGK